MIRTLIFDLCGVIIPLNCERRYAMFEPYSPYDSNEISRRISESGLVDGLDTGTLAARDFAAGISEVLNLNGVGFDEFCRIWCGVFEPPVTLVPEEFLESLHRERRTVLLSNSNPIHFPYIEEHYPLVRHFDACVLSFRVGDTKPSAEMYAEAVIQAQCAPDECFFVDDLEKNVTAARREGIRAAQFRNYEQIRAELDRLS